MNYGVKITASFLLISLAIFSHAGYLDDWTDDQICGWMENPSPPEYIVDEAVKRNLDCAPESAKKKAEEEISQKIMIYDADFSQSDLEELSSETLKTLCLSHCHAARRGRPLIWADDSWFPRFNRKGSFVSP